MSGAMRTIASYGSKRSPAKRPSPGCVNTTNRRSPNWAITASRRCAPRRWRCTKPTPKSRLSGVPASTCTTSGAMRCTPGASGAAPLLRSTSKDSPEWDVLIDVDALAAEEDQNWVWGGADVIQPECTRALIGLSRGGGDASVVREFDIATRQFVADGFNLPEAKTDIGWEDEDTVLVGTDFGEGTLTESGYPLLVKRWRRGTPLEDAETIFSGAATRRRGGCGLQPLSGIRAHIRLPPRRLLQQGDRMSCAPANWSVSTFRPTAASRFTASGR